MIHSTPCGLVDTYIVVDYAVETRIALYGDVVSSYPSLYSNRKQNSEQSLWKYTWDSHLFLNLEKNAIHPSLWFYLIVGKC